MEAKTNIVDLTENSKSKIKIFEVDFNWKLIDNEYCIYHNTWSLRGYGANFHETFTNLLEEAREIKDYYTNTPENELTAGAIELRDFLLKII